MRDLLYGLMLPSGNDAALEIAKNTWGTVPAFVDRMNAKAPELGLANTHFVNPHGLDGREHYSSAYDLAMLGRYGMANPAFREVANARVHRLGPPADYNVYNGNSLPDVYAGAEGVKIGWTNRARWTLVTSATRNGHTLYATVLGSENRDADAAALFDWAFASHEWRPLGTRLTAVMRLAHGLGVDEPISRLVGTCA
jgi:D-alanyl-D-alanine carboxypeptidase